MATPLDTTSDNTGWPCSFCSNIYATQAGVRQHENRYCTRRPANPTSCQYCERTFDSYAGMRLHQSKAHEAEYNEDLQNEAASARKKWTEDEEKELAKIEAGMIGQKATKILDKLVEVSGRTRESIKGRRRMVQYKTLVSYYSSLPTEPITPEVSYGIQESSELISDIRSYINSFPTNIMDADDFRLLEKINNNSNLLEANTQYLETITSRFTQNHTIVRNQNNSLINALNNARSNRIRKRILYKLTQKEYTNNKSEYANRLLDNQPWSVLETTPTDNEILRHFQGSFGCFAETGLPNAINTQHNETIISRPITIEEVVDNTNSLKSNAPGPDGITKKKLRKIPARKLTLLFNLFLLAENFPAQLKRNNTTIIPKTTTELENPKNWRPITISSIILRLFNKIIAKRLSNIELLENQRGFSKIDGCFANTWTVENLIKHRRLKGQPLTLISLDLTAAFDSVPHNAILRALRRTKVDQNYINLVQASFTESSTNIYCNGRSVGTVPILRGVKQGDPASPIHFNIFLDELLNILHDDFSGISIDGNKLCCLAYADDLILIAETPDDGKRMLRKTVDFLTSMCMSLNANKCSTLVLKTVPAKKKVCIDNRTSFKIGNSIIPSVNTGNSFKYLGYNFTFKGLARPGLDELFDQLKRISRAPLKPNQKMSILKEHLVPRYIANLQRPNITAKILAKADRKIRMAARNFLHLNRHCHSSIFYAPIRAGGLGIFCFSDNIPIIIKDRIAKLRNSSNILNATFQLGLQRLESINKMIKPGSENKKDIKTKHIFRLERSYSGNGVSQVKHSKASTQHLTTPPKCWTGEDFIRSIHLRYNLLPSMGIPSNPPEARRCRAGCDRTESLSHILQKCPLTHTKRINRHDYIVKRLTDAASKQRWMHILEPNIRCNDGTLRKPDIIFVKNNSLIICDVGVHWEGPLSLDAHYNTKVSKYSTPEFITAMQQRYPQHTISVLPFIVGARGIWCKQNKFLSHHLHLNKFAQADIIATTIKGSIIIHRDFMKCVWRTQRPPPRRALP